MLPPFNRDGVLPPGEHLCEWEEFAARFEGEADNGRRRRLILGLAQMGLLLLEAGCAFIWVDGSFVTRERWPRDFDLCYDFAQVDTALLHPLLADFSGGRWRQKQEFGGEALPHDLPFRPNGETVLEAFKRDRSNNEKGLARLNLAGSQAVLQAWIEERQNAQKE